MTTIASCSRVRRAFACWPSRIGVAALVLLGVSWGSEAFAQHEAGGAAYEQAA
ncbi:hypothetical protein [Methylopila henanensis]|uniref:hypothetical protein n=1 Tax=Methylopila henanensis TaxID=873516 RepID=UPI00366CBF8C